MYAHNGPLDINVLFFVFFLKRDLFIITHIKSHIKNSTALCYKHIVESTIECKNNQSINDHDYTLKMAQN